MSRAYEKGKEIHFIGGKYAGKKGWYNKAEESKQSKRVHVLIDRGEEKSLKAACVNRSSISKERFRILKNNAEAILHQCPDLE